MNIWQACQGEKHIGPISCTAWRVVEAQHRSTTRQLVDNLSEHDLLEQLIDNVKPYIDPDSYRYHYLLFTPFRYPPLKYGSRFGTATQRGIWYGSLKLSTAFAEVALYRMKFLSDTQAEIKYNKLLLTAFNAKVDTEQGIDLTKSPFSEYQQHISDPDSHQHSQALADEMRSEQVKAFCYQSARSSEEATNIGIFELQAFQSTEPNTDVQTWQCISTAQSIEFYRENVFKQEQYVWLRDKGPVSATY